MVTCGARNPSVELGAIIPLSELQKEGLCLFRYKDEILLSLDDIAWCDVLLIVRGASSLSLRATQCAKRLEKLVIGYWDDDFLSIPEYNLFYSYYSSPVVRHNVNVLFGLADAFFSPSPKLAAKLSTLHRNEAKVLPAIMALEEFPPIATNTNRTPIVGYAGSPVHAIILNSLCGPAIAGVADTNVKFKVHVVGPRPDFLDKLPIETTYTPYIGDYYKYLAFATNLAWGIGLAPQIDDEFTTFKFYNKLLECSYIGCAGIYSKLEPYTSVVEDGITGLLVENEVAAWKEAMLRLLSDSKLRFALAANAREYVQNHHNRKVVTQQYATILEPFLSYRAPGTGRIAGFTNNMLYNTSKAYALGAEYAKVYGLRGIIRGILNRLLRLLGVKLL